MTMQFVKRRSSDWGMYTIKVRMWFLCVLLPNQCPQTTTSTRWKLLLVLSSFGNCGLPFIFTQSLFRDTPDLLSDLLGGMSFYILGWSTAFWTIGYWLIESATQGEHCSKHSTNFLLAGLRRAIWGLPVRWPMASDGSQLQQSIPVPQLPNLPKSNNLFGTECMFLGYHARLVLQTRFNKHKEIYMYIYLYICMSLCEEKV